jgi:tetratricopeptide (TPR) repeat protein
MKFPKIIKISSVTNKYPNIDIIASLIFLSLLIIALYWRVNGYDFVSLDDSFIYNAPQLKNGLSITNILWAFSNDVTTLWIPVTWISFFLDYEIYGMNPGGYHITNVILHICNTLLLFSILYKITEKKWQSFFVAALFSCHPIHVESIAWITERKDVLSTFFLMLFFHSYLKYTKKENIGSYLCAMLFFFLGLMSKPMLVTVPVVLILLDYWPLSRFEKNGTLKIFLEKIPFLNFSLLVSLKTIFIQLNAGALVSFESINIINRIENAVTSYIAYLVKLLLPINLAVVYPYEQSFSLWEVFVKFVIFVAITTLALKAHKKHPYLIVGWLWYVISLVPVIGLFQSGAQSLADRFVYIPFIGIYIILAWGIPHFLQVLKTPRIVAFAIFFMVLPVLSTLTWFQVSYWRNSSTLYAHTLAVTDNNWLIHNNYGMVLEEKGKTKEATGHFQEAINIKPDLPVSHLNLANNLYRLGEISEAERHYKMIIAVSTDKEVTAKAHNRLAFIYQMQRKNNEAIKHYKKALHIQPTEVKALNNLAILLAQMGDFPNAAINFKRALEFSPQDEETLNNLGLLSIKIGNLNKGIFYFKEALKYNPAYKPAQNNLARYMNNIQTKK